MTGLSRATPWPRRRRTPWPFPKTACGPSAYPPRGNGTDYSRAYGAASNEATATTPICIRKVSYSFSTYSATEGGSAVSVRVTFSPRLRQAPVHPHNRERQRLLHPGGPDQQQSVGSRGGTDGVLHHSGQPGLRLRRRDRHPGIRNTADWYGRGENFPHSP